MSAATRRSRELVAPSSLEPLQMIAHENALARLSNPAPGEAETPPGGLPADSYFTPTKDFHFNGEAVFLYHAPNAHTDGDTIVLFRESDVVSTGDLFTPGGYPFIDRERGGSVQGLIAGLNQILHLTVPAKTQERGTYVIPGHGRICDEADVVEFRDMVVIVRDRVARHDRARHDAQADPGRAPDARLRHRVRQGRQLRDGRRVRRSRVPQPHGGTRDESVVARRSCLPRRSSRVARARAAATAPAPPQRRRALRRPSTSRAIGYRRSWRTGAGAWSRRSRATPRAFPSTPPHAPSSTRGTRPRTKRPATQCKAYGAPALLRVPGRLRIRWQDDDTLEIAADAGEQTRLLHFGAPPRGRRRSRAGKATRRPAGAF